ncbi:MAG: FAD-binding protein, partial [Bacteriovoracaceae bacterium]
MKSYYPKSLSELKNILKDHTPGIFFGSRTSTVIPGELALEKMAHIYLGELEKRIEIKKNSVVITGPVTWEELHRELQFDQQALFPSPTDWTAQVLASLSTSASGEMNFSKGNLRDKVYRIKYLDFNGDEKVLSSGQSLNIDHPRLS